MWRWPSVDVFGAHQLPARVVGVHHTPGAPAGLGERVRTATALLCGSCLTEPTLDVAYQLGRP